MNIWFKVFSLIIISIFASNSIRAQDQSFCKVSPDGVYVLMSNAGASPSQPYQQITGYAVLRAEGNSGSFREIARVTRPADLASFRSLAGEELVEQIKEVKRLDSDAALWDYISNHPRLEDYDFLVLNPRLGVALGAYYLDASVKDVRPGTTFQYQVQYLSGSGETNTPMTGSVIVGERTRSSVPRISKIMESDTLIALLWSAPTQNNDDIFFANVYRQTGGGGPFEMALQKVMVNRDEDSLHFYWQEKVVPEVLYRYFIVPTDLFGNPGTPSDTVSTISVEFAATPLLRDVSAVDTLGGIVVQWKALPEKAYWTGVMVERSRDARGNFVVLDTVAATASHYLDQRALPNTAYYYRLKAVTLRLDQTPPSTVVSADWRNEILPPLPPHGLRGSNEGQHIKLVWEASPEPDLFAYYVYRGRGSLDSMEVVSPPLKETVYLDTAQNLNGRNDYTYAVRAVNLSEMVSEFSNFVSIRPLRFTAPPAPQGIAAFNEGIRIRLGWPDVSEMEENVIGYQVYRRELQSGDKQKIPENFNGLSASLAAVQYGFSLIANVPAPYYDDLDFTAGKTYQYVVSAIDAVGIESVLSAVATVAVEDTPLPAPAEVYVRGTSSGIALEWGASMLSGLKGYIIYRRSGNEPNPVKIAEVPLQQNNFLDSKVSEGSLYFYSVSVVTSERESTRSAEKGGRK